MNDNLINKKNTEYDVRKLKENISNIIKKNNITQSQLSDEIGIAQSRISRILNIENSDFFTVEQLVCISDVLSVSTDELLGISRIKKNVNITVRHKEVIEMLFTIDEYMRLSIETHSESINHHTDQLEYEDLDSKVLMHELCFDECSPYGFYMNDFMKEWKEVKEFCTGKDIGDKMYEMWKDSVLKNAEEKVFDLGEYSPLPFN